MSFSSSLGRAAGRWAARTALLLWLAAMIGLGALLLVSHTIPLPTPRKDDPAVAAAVAARAPHGSWFAVHILYRQCPCSGRVLAHLLAGGRPADLRERVVLVDETAREDAQVQALRAAGFDVELLTPAQLLERWHDEATPLLVVADPEGNVRYLGGYGRHKQSPAIEDLAILADLRADRTRDALPVFGCPATRGLARRLDPLRLKSWR
ncbi:MAG TPA: hypothetical protein VHE35_22025 [Kofleriaceae bacterium]|nr:hypothetical protein [Kofleriaceae bacterium]